MLGYLEFLCTLFRRLGPINLMISGVGFHAVKRSRLQYFELLRKYMNRYTMPGVVGSPNYKTEINMKCA